MSISNNHFQTPIRTTSKSSSRVTSNSSYRTTSSNSLGFGSDGPIDYFGSFFHNSNISFSTDSLNVTPFDYLNDYVNIIGNQHGDHINENNDNNINDTYNVQDDINAEDNNNTSISILTNSPSRRINFNEDYENSENDDNADLYVRQDFCVTQISKITYDILCTQNEMCVICHNNYDISENYLGLCETECKHHFHLDCLTSYMAHCSGANQEIKCPLCRSNI